tara:strand:- start:786 stop:1571 length:786 start_codon:yes stop_codon:yes gene_type:complete
MPLPAAIATLPALGKTLGVIGTKALPYLPALGAAGGAYSQRERGLGGMLQGGLVGGASTWGLGGPISGAMRPAARMAGGLAQGAGLSGPALGVIAGGTRAALPLAAGLGIGGMSAGLSIPAIGGAGGAAANRLNQSGVGPMGDPLGGLPPGTTARMMGPEGNWWYQLDPSGVAAGNRLGRQLGAQTDANVINTLGNALYGQTERVAKSELARQSAAAQLKANIEQAKAMALNSQTAGLNIGMSAGQGMANAMSNRSNFRYL